ncbi:MAG TPA: O-antigen ligase family protein, partial [Candidatus Paceibacterota bacterium]|nr:O-antigen ligase family protein [Candidatus Paceibacterota bacterium]
RDRISRSWPNIRAIRQRLVLVGIVVLLASVVFLVAFWPSVWARAAIHSSDEAVQLRLDYARDALSTGRGWNLNWTGVGIGGFVPWLMRHDPALPPYLYQPAHSLPLLAYAETGILGAAALVAFLAFIAFRAWRAHAAQPLLRVGVLALFGALVFISLTDHFFWTLQQGRILWWLVLALAAGRD